MQLAGQEIRGLRYAQDSPFVLIAVRCHRDVEATSPCLLGGDHLVMLPATGTPGTNLLAVWHPFHHPIQSHESRILGNIKIFLILSCILLPGFTHFHSSLPSGKWKFSSPLFNGTGNNSNPSHCSWIICVIVLNIIRQMGANVFLFMVDHFGIKDICLSTYHLSIIYHWSVIYQS